MMFVRNPQANISWMHGAHFAIIFLACVSPESDLHLNRAIPTISYFELKIKLVNIYSNCGGGV